MGAVSCRSMDRVCRDEDSRSFLTTCRLFRSAQGVQEAGFRRAAARGAHGARHRVAGV